MKKPKHPKFKLKVCGMKYPENIEQLSVLKPGFIGFIFYEKSKRFVGEDFDIKKMNINPDIQKTGVFVNASKNYILEKVKKYGLNLVQLHGNETPEFCQSLQKNGFAISKAFPVGEGFDFKNLDAYKTVCDYFLFDTKTPLYGGSGYKFDWNILRQYDNEKPFFLSGGIDGDDVEAIYKLADMNIFAIDINSKFETEPGKKDIGKIGLFMEMINLAKKQIPEKA